jgi:hypothetical protein
MKIKELEIYKTNQERTLVKGDKSGKYYVVSSVNLGGDSAAFDAMLGITAESETMIFSCDKNGEEISFRDLWLTRPRDHTKGILIASEETELYFPDEEN